MEPGVVVEIPIDQIVSGLGNPREEFRQKPLQELADNISARGVRQPITVLPSGPNEFLIKTGERRWRASKLAGLETVPCLLDDAGGDTADLLIDQIAENELREGLSPIERAKALQRLRDDGKTLTEIAQLLQTHGMSMSRPAISNTLRLLRLPESTQALISEGKVRESYARELVPVESMPELVEAVCQAAIDEDWLRVDADYYRNVIESELYDRAKRVYDGDGCDKCECLIKVVNSCGDKLNWCTNPEKLTAKRVDAEQADHGTEQAEPATKKKKAEIDPSKVKPAKVKTSAGGAVALQRRKTSSYSRLEHAAFDTSDCMSCPHQHLASYDGDKESAEPACFYVPCYENLKRQQQKLDRRETRIREIIDDQLHPHLVETAKQPVAESIILPLMAYIACGYPVAGDTSKIDADDEYVYVRSAGPANYTAGDRSTSRLLGRAPVDIGRGTLRSFFEAPFSAGDADQLVEAAIAALNLEQRRELAMHLSIDIGSFWKTSEDYASLFTKPEIVALIGDAYEGADGPAGQWKQRLTDYIGVPDQVREIWNSPIDNIAGDAL